MKIKDNLILRKVADSYVVIPVGEGALDFNGIITLNETGAFLFELMQKGTDRDELVVKLLETYDVSRETAEKDADRFINRVKDAGILEQTG